MTSFLERWLDHEHKDLIIGDRIRIQEVNGVEITVQIKNVYRLVQSSLDIDKWVADVEAIDGELDY